MMSWKKLYYFVKIFLLQGIVANLVFIIYDLVEVSPKESIGFYEICRMFLFGLFYFAVGGGIVFIVNIFIMVNEESFYKRIFYCIVLNVIYLFVLERLMKYPVLEAYLLLPFVISTIITNIFFKKSLS